MAEHESNDLRLADALERFCQALDDGADPDPAELLATHSDLDGLAECLEVVAPLGELRAELLPLDAEPLAAAEAMRGYEIVREVGRGGMSVVYEAWAERLQCRVALKVLKAGEPSPEERERFRAAARMVAQLRHPNIVQVYDVDEHQGLPFLVEEFVDGINLDQQIKRAPLPPGAAAELVEVLARAMHFAHQKNIVHRDLKPANILLQNGANGSKPAIPKVTDFGLAKWLDGSAALTQTGAVMGTPSYMAPEQAEGRADLIGPATDVYALGAILYEALTGRPPFKAATPTETLAQVLREDPAPPRRLQPLVPWDLQTICLKCLCKEPGGRYASAADLADDLGRFTRGEPIRARPIGVFGRAWRWARRHPGVAGLLGVAAALTTLVVVLLVLRFANATAQRARDDVRRNKILSGNVFAANHLANTILVHLWRLAEAVDQTANDPRLHELMRKDDRSGLQAYFEEVHRKDPERGIKGPDGTSAFHTWHVTDANGILLADAPLPKESVVGKPYVGRDYFQGATRHSGVSGRARIHVSRAYRSDNDTLYKITLSAVVYAGPDSKGPILGVVCATLPTDASLGSLSLQDKLRTAVLVGRRDLNNPREVPKEEAPAEYLILVHPAYGELPEFARGKKAVTMPREMLRLVPQPRPGDEFVSEARSIGAAETLHEDDAYEDPLGKGEGEVHAKYAGHWLAGFAPVGNTEMIVIVQQRDEEPLRVSWLEEWALTAIIVLTVGAMAAAWLVSRRQRREASRVPAALPRPDQEPTISVRAGTAK